MNLNSWVESINLLARTEYILALASIMTLLSTMILLILILSVI